MVARIRRNRPVAVKPDLVKIEGLMKSISQLQDTAAEASRKAAVALSDLQESMGKGKLTQHVYGDLVAEVYRSAGRSTNIVDPVALRKLIKDDKDYYSCVVVSNTAVKKILAEKQLAPITRTIDAKPGEEQVRVSRRG